MNFNAIIDNINSQEEGQKRKPFELAKDKEILEQSTYYEKRIYDLEQLLDIAKSFCQNLDFGNLLESIVYISMAQMHVLGAEIFVRDPITNDVLNLETAKAMSNGQKLSIPVASSIISSLRSSGVLGAYFSASSAIFSPCSIDSLLTCIRSSTDMSNISASWGRELMSG